MSASGIEVPRCAFRAAPQRLPRGERVGRRMIGLHVRSELLAIAMFIDDVAESSPLRATGALVCLLTHFYDGIPRLDEIFRNTRTYIVDTINLKAVG